MEKRKIVITGGPHSGKTTVLERLREMGMQVIPEVPRMIIEKELAKERENPGYQGILPGKRQEEFNRLVMEKQMELEKRSSDGIIFLDRSLVDPVAYAEFYGVAIHPELHSHIQNAGYERVFLMDQVPGMKMDEVRTENDSGKEVHEKISEVYSRLGFPVKNVDIFEIGEQGVKKRVEHILRKIKENPERTVEIE